MKHINLNKFFTILTLLIIVDCGIGAAIAVWREYYWASVSDRVLDAWIVLLVIFSVLALISCWVSSYTQYVGSVIALRKRTVLTQKAMKLNNYQDIEGGPQRIQEDCSMYPRLSISLLTGLTKCVIMIIVFSILIVKQVGVFYLIIGIIYATAGTLIAGRISIPLINLNYLNQVAEAAFREHLSKLNYIKAHRNNFDLFRYTKYLQYFQGFFNQITVIVPYVILGSLYFGSKITFGVFMQATSALAELINNMSFVLNSFNDINKWLSCRKRLRELDII